MGFFSVTFIGGMEVVVGVGEGVVLGVGGGKVSLV